METEFGISVASKEADISLANYVCVSIKAVIAEYKKIGIVNKAKLRMLQDECDKRIAAREINNEAELSMLTMQKIIDFTRRFDVNTMDEISKKIYFDLNYSRRYKVLAYQPL